VQGRSLLSLPAALALAAVITTGIFLLMYYLIHTDATRQETLEQITLVDIKPPEPEEEDQAEDDEPEPVEKEPLLPELDVVMQSPSLDLNIDIPAVAMDVGDLDIRASGNFLPPAIDTAGNNGSSAAGKRGEGFRIVIPSATRQPNVPKVAWDNKIDGWVLASFVVFNNGTVGRIRIMDSHQVIRSIQDWRYDPFPGSPIQLTQKIELFWKDYPNNIRQLY
jgi:hypothetical protein